MVSFITIFGNLIYVLQIIKNIGFKIYKSNKWDNAYVKNHQYDYLNNGLFTVADFNLGPINLFNSMFFTYDSLEAIKGAGNSIAGLYSYTNRSYISTQFENENLNSKILQRKEYLSIGNGLFDKLFISDNCEPLDQIAMDI